MKKWSVSFHRQIGFTIEVEEFSDDAVCMTGKWQYPAFAHEHASVILAQVSEPHPELWGAIADAVATMYRDQYKCFSAGIHVHEEVKRKPKSKRPK